MSMSRPFFLLLSWLALTISCNEQDPQTTRNLTSNTEKSTENEEQEKPDCCGGNTEEVVPPQSETDFIEEASEKASEETVKEQPPRCCGKNNKDHKQLDDSPPQQTTKTSNKSLKKKPLPSSKNTEKKQSEKPTSCCKDMKAQTEQEITLDLSFETRKRLLSKEELRQEISPEKLSSIKTLNLQGQIEFNDELLTTLGESIESNPDIIIDLTNNKNFAGQEEDLKPIIKNIKTDKL